MDLFIRGYHVYEEVWTATFEEQLYTEGEYGNVVELCCSCNHGITFDISFSFPIEY